jgi:extracellular factor (EF) 3-hydroxypalmitic acid methyl ester biosynthesis protein
LDLGCGPAREIQDFLAESVFSDHAQFTLMDFNEETLQHASQALRQKQQQYRRNLSVELVKKSVQQLLKDMVRADGLSRGNKFDFIYCAGLFDYLPDRTCKQLMTLFYQSLAPGGLVLATNVSPFSPNRGSLELILDWHLIYRDAAQVAELRPRGVPPTEVCVSSDDTGVNVFLEVRAAHDR